MKTSFCKIVSESQYGIGREVEQRFSISFLNNEKEGCPSNSNCAYDFSLLILLNTTKEFNLKYPELEYFEISLYNQYGNVLQIFESQDIKFAPPPTCVISKIQRFFFL